jgi:hypothetical protein
MITSACTTVPNNLYSICGKPHSSNSGFDAEQYEEFIHIDCLGSRRLQVVIRNSSRLTQSRRKGSRLTTKGIVDLLTAMNTPPEYDQQCECGSPMERAICTVSFNGRTWSVPLTSCPVCNPTHHEYHVRRVA